MEDPSSNDCSLCMETLDKCSVVHLNCCSSQKIHIECYVKSLPKCPFCRKLQPTFVPPIIVVTDWPKVRKSIFTAFAVTACMSITILLTNQC